MDKFFFEFFDFDGVVCEYMDFVVFFKFFYEVVEMFCNIVIVGRVVFDYQDFYGGKLKVKLKSVWECFFEEFFCEFFECQVFFFGYFFKEFLCFVVVLCGFFFFFCYLFGDFEMQGEFFEDDFFGFIYYFSFEWQFKGKVYYRKGEEGIFFFNFVQYCYFVVFCEVFFGDEGYVFFYKFGFF